MPQKPLSYFKIENSKKKNMLIKTSYSDLRMHKMCNKMGIYSYRKQTMQSTLKSQPLLITLYGGCT